MEKSKQNFFKKYEDLSDQDYRLELLWSQKIIQSKLHRIRKNLTRINWIVATFIIIFILSIFASKYINDL